MGSHNIMVTALGSRVKWPRDSKLNDNILFLFFKNELNSMK